MTDNAGEVVTQEAREAAWPFRAGCYTEEDRPAWNEGRYDGCPVIQAFARFQARLTSTRAQVERTGNCYTAHGKHIKRGREHIADAVDSTYAQIIADALNGERCPVTMEQIVPDDPRVAHLCDPLRNAISNSSIVIEPKHNIVPRPDGGYHCSCGRSWDRDEGDECPGAAS